MALLEGISLIILMAIGMPLKYMAGMPETVKVVGWAHGLLFVLYIWVLLRVWMERDWSIGRVAVAFIVSFLPFGTIVFDRSLKREVEAG